MRRLALRLFVALLAFFIGVGAAMLLGGWRLDRPSKYRRGKNAVYVLPAREAPPAPRFHSCPSAKEFGATPFRTMPMIPSSSSPLPAAPAAGDREVRIRIKRAGGRVEVIKTRPAERKKF